jgi:DNA-binding PadR family transcriptional regulator
VSANRIPQNQDLYGGLIRLHILHHAAREPLYGSWMMKELQHHGYRISPGTLYPMLHGLEAKGYLRSHEQRSGKQVKRLYAITARGRRVLADAQQKVRELFGELFEKS